MSLSKLRGNENIADVITLEPYADIDQIRETLINVIRWLGDREPVAPGDVFLKFATWGGLVDRKVLSEKDILTNDDNPGDGDPPDEPEELYVEFMAREMTPSVTNGCTAFAATELDPTQPNLHYLEFPDGVDTSCDFTTILPAGWIGGTFQVRIYWSHGFGSVGAWDVTWEVQTNTYYSGQTLARVLVPGVVIDTTGGTADDLYITAESGPVPILGSLNKPGNYVSIRIFRRGSTDTMTIPARLHAVRFNLGAAPVDYPPPPSPAALLLSFDGDFDDESSNNFPFTATGGLTTSATRFKWGPQALTFDGTNRVSTPYQASLAFGGGFWSVDFWIYVPSSVTLATDNCAVCVWTATGTISWYIGLSTTGRLRVFTSTDGSTGAFWDASAGNITRDAWVHVAVWQNATSINAALDGSIYGVATAATLFNANTGLTIGATGAGAATMPSGVTIDELRICLGAIDYDNASFTPPAGPY